MQKITMFYLTDCGYCHKAHRAIEELMAQNADYAKLEIEKIEEDEHMDIAETYDYYAVPTFYIGREKLFEAHIGMTYEDIREEVRKVFDAALAR